MNLYQQTSKRLDVFLSREQRLVYTLCREVISDVVLAQRTQLALDVVQGILAELQEKGLVEQIAGSPPRAESTAGMGRSGEGVESSSAHAVATPSPETAISGQSGQTSEDALRLKTAKAQFMAALEAVLGSQAHKYQQELEAKQSLAELEEWGRKLVLKLRLTVSQKAAQALDEKLKSLL